MRNPAGPESGPAMFLQIVDGVLHGEDLFGCVVGNFDAEFFLEGHDEFDCVQTVGAKIINKAGTFRDLGLVHAQMLNDDLLYALGNIVAHSSKTPVYLHSDLARQTY